MGGAAGGLPFQSPFRFTRMSASPFEPDEHGLIRDCPECGQANRLRYERMGLLFRCASCKTELPEPSEPVDIPDALTFDSLIRKASLPVLADFWAPWCGPCKMIAPELVKVAQAGAGAWLVVKVNTENMPHVGSRFRITGIPTLVLFDKGGEVARQSGVMPSATVIRFIKDSLA